MIRLKTSCLNCLNANCIIKKYVPKECLNEIDDNKIIHRYTKRQIIFLEDNETDYIYFIQKGVIKVLKNGAYNKDQIIRFSLAGDILGHRGFNDSGLYPVSAEAIMDSEICYLTKTYFFELLKKVPALSIKLMLIYSNELYREEKKLRDMALFNVREKVAKALLIGIDTFGLNKNNEINHIETLSRQDIADSVGLTSNQVTKVFGEFKKDSIIETIGKKIIISNQNSLLNMVNY